MKSNKFNKIKSIKSNKVNEIKKRVVFTGQFQDAIFFIQQYVY